MSSLVSSLVDLALLEVSASKVSGSTFTRTLLRMCRLIRLFMYSCRGGAGERLGAGLLATLAERGLQYHAVITLRVFNVRSVRFGMLGTTSTQVSLSRICTVLGHHRRISR